MAGEPAQKVTREDVRRALAESGGDLRAVGAQLGLETRELLMILAYDVTVTATGEKTSDLASDVFDSLAPKKP